MHYDPHPHQLFHTLMLLTQRNLQRAEDRLVGLEMCKSYELIPMLFRDSGVANPRVNSETDLLGIVFSTN